MIVFLLKYLSSMCKSLTYAYRPMPDAPDARAKLIDALHLSGKLPSNMYKNDIELCQKECTELLTGMLNTYFVSVLVAFIDLVAFDYFVLIISHFDFMYYLL